MTSEDSGTAAATETTPARRYPIVAVVLLIVAAACLWGASRMTWVRVHSADGLGVDRTDSVIGSSWVAVLTPLALLLVAATAAAFALRGWAVRLLGVLIALAAAAIAVPAFALLTGHIADKRAKQIASLPDRAHITAVDSLPLPAILTMVGALAAFAAALLLVRKPGVRAGLSSKYDNPTARKEDAARRVAGESPDTELSERTLWDALDAGEDPTTGKE